jgi:hypothetical protein
MIPYPATCQSPTNAPPNASDPIRPIRSVPFVPQSHTDIITRGSAALGRFGEGRDCRMAPSAARPPPRGWRSTAYRLQYEVVNVVSGWDDFAGGGFDGYMYK